jgi:hypothetical protein
MPETIMRYRIALQPVFSLKIAIDCRLMYKNLPIYAVNDRYDLTAMRQKKNVLNRGKYG